MYQKIRVFVLLVFFLLIILSACQSGNNQEYTPQFDSTSAITKQKVEYIFAIHPLHNPDRMFELYQPLVDCINSTTTEFSVKLESSKDYSKFEEKLFDRKFHFALPNPYQTVKATKFGYKIFGKMGDDNNFCGLVLVRKDSHIRDISDLRNKSISFPSATALAAAMMPKYYLKILGIDVEKDAECRYVGSQESSIMNVFLGKTNAACTWPPPWKVFSDQHPEVKDALRILLKTDPLINNGLVVRDDIPQSHLRIFENTIFNLNQTENGKRILKKMDLSQFEKVTQNDYVRKVNSFLEQYKLLFVYLPGEERIAN